MYFLALDFVFNEMSRGERWGMEGGKSKMDEKVFGSTLM